MWVCAWRNQILSRSVLLSIHFTYPHRFAYPWHSLPPTPSVAQNASGEVFLITRMPLATPSIAQNVSRNPQAICLPTAPLRCSKHVWRVFSSPTCPFPAFNPLHHSHFQAEEVFLVFNILFTYLVGLLYLVYLFIYITVDTCWVPAVPPQTHTHEQGVQVRRFYPRVICVVHYSGHLTRRAEGIHDTAGFKLDQQCDMSYLCWFTTEDGCALSDLHHFVPCITPLLSCCIRATTSSSSCFLIFSLHSCLT